MDPSHAMWRRNNRPVCRMWQMGRCNLSSIQCEFRHAEPGLAAQPLLDEGFAPQPRLYDYRWTDPSLQQGARQPLQEIVLPASSYDVYVTDQARESMTHSRSNSYEEVDQRSWRSPGRGHQRFPSRDASTDGQTGVPGGHVPMGFVWQREAFNALRNERDGHDDSPDPTEPGRFENIRIWEDREYRGFHGYDFIADIPASDSESEDEISRLAEVEEESDEEASDKENDYPENVSVMYDGEESQRQASDVDVTQRTDAATRESSPLQHSSTIPSTDNSSFTMSQARDAAQNGGAPQNEGVGPHPSYIQVAKPYIFEQSLQASLNALGATEHKEDSIRLQGVQYIDTVRRALQLPVRTFNTAVVYYHKFRLVHADSEYMFADAAAAALFTACKIEDTLKKSREVLCAAYNLKVAPSEHLSPDDPIFEQPSKTVVGLERLMLESAGFDFRNRHPQEIVLKLVRDSGLPKDTLGRTSFNISIDIYRTFAPLKQTAQTMAIACVELAARLLNSATDFNMDTIVGPQGISLEKWSTTRGEIMETLLDLLDLFTHHRNATIVGNQFPIDNYIAIRITLNKEATSSNLPRYTNWIDAPKSVLNGASNGAKHSPLSPAVASSNQTPASPPAMGPTTATGARGRVGERGKDGTVRFMLSAERARGEKEAVAKYFAPDEYETYEEEVDVPLGQ